MLRNKEIFFQNSCVFFVRPGTCGTTDMTGICTTSIEGRKIILKDNR